MAKYILQFAEKDIREEVNRLVNLHEQSLPIDLNDKILHLANKCYMYKKSYMKKLEQIKEGGWYAPRFTSPNHNHIDIVDFQYTLKIAIAELKELRSIRNDQWFVKGDYLFNEEQRRLNRQLGIHSINYKKTF